MTFNERINVFGCYIVNLKIRYFLLIIVLIQFILHIPIFNMPPMGQHVWRQVMGLSMAYNYYQEDLNFLESAQDIRIGEDDRGLVYTEFPLIYWLIGKSYHATGFSHINGRLTAFLFSILLIFSSYNLVKLFKYDEVICRWFVFFLSFTPFFFYYSISLLPNLPSLSLFITGIVLIYPKIKENKSQEENIKKVIKDELLTKFKEKKFGGFFPQNKSLYIIAGNNGSGKTTFIGKFINLIQKNGLKPAVIAADTFRAAAIDQLEHFTNQFEVPIHKGNNMEDPSAVIFQGIDNLKESDVIIVDTSGRQHNNKNLMAELKKITDIVSKKSLK